MNAEPADPNKPVARKRGRMSKEELRRMEGDLKAMALRALDMAGGDQWFARQADKNPVAFMNFLAKILPYQIEATATSFNYTVQTLQVSYAPVPGVINDGLPSSENQVLPNPPRPWHEQGTPALDAPAIAMKAMKLRALALREAEATDRMLDALDAEGSGDE